MSTAPVSPSLFELQTNLSRCARVEHHEQTKTARLRAELAEAERDLVRATNKRIDAQAALDLYMLGTIHGG